MNGINGKTAAGLSKWVKIGMEFAKGLVEKKGMARK